MGSNKYNIFPWTRTTFSSRPRKIGNDSQGFGFTLFQNKWHLAQDPNKLRLLVRDAVTKKTRRQNSGDYVKYNDDNVDDYEYGPGNAEYYEEQTQQGNSDSASIQER